MSQYYVGIKQVFAWPEERDGKPGYAVVYRHGQHDAYQSWSPKDEFERFYLPQGNDPTRVTQAMVDGFIGDATHPATVGGKMTVLNVELKNGTVFAESSACVDPKNYDEKLGASICMTRVKDRVWHLLGFALQWARRGLAVVAVLLSLSASLSAADLGPRITTTDGGSYTRAADGHYYPSGQAVAASRPAYLPSVVPANYPPIAAHSPPIASYSSCPGGNCPTGFRPAPRFAFPVK